MSDSITLALPDDLSAKVWSIAKDKNQSVEQVLLDYLKSVSESLPALEPNEQEELDALVHLSDDTLWTIARDHLSDAVQARAHTLMQKNNTSVLTNDEQDELDNLVARADQLMLRKAEAATILRQRGHDFSQEDFSRETIALLAFVTKG